jgi:hypothetical protein
MRRTVTLGAAWTASAAAAVGLGFLAVSLVDASASPRSTDVAVTRTSASDLLTPPASSAPTATSGVHVTAGGSVFASCVAGAPSLAGAPAPGWWMDDSSEPGKVEFRNGTQKVEVHTVCVGDEPQFSDDGLRADDAGHGGGSTDPTPTPSGSHGSDDPAGHDSSGSGGGGHGADG